MMEEKSPWPRLCWWSLNTAISYNVISNSRLLDRSHNIIISTFLPWLKISKYPQIIFTFLPLLKISKYPQIIFTLLQLLKISEYPKIIFIFLSLLKISKYPKIIFTSLPLLCEVDSENDSLLQAAVGWKR